MRILSVHFVAMATKPLRAHLNADWRERKRPRTGGEN